MTKHGDRVCLAPLFYWVLPKSIYNSWLADPQWASREPWHTYLLHQHNSGGKTSSPSQKPVYCSSDYPWKNKVLAWEMDFWKNFLIFYSIRFCIPLSTIQYVQRLKKNLLQSKSFWCMLSSHVFITLQARMEKQYAKQERGGAQILKKE